MEFLNNGPIILGVIGAVLSAFVIGLRIGVKLERSNCERWKRQSAKDNERFVRNARG